MANKNLQNSVTYKKFQRRLFQTKIDNKKLHLRTFQNEFNRSRNELQFKLSCINFAHISAIFLSSNNSLLKIPDSIQQKKFNKLLIENRPKQDTAKVISSFSKRSLNNAEKAVLVNGLSIALPPKQLSYSDYLVNFELCYRSIDNLKILSGDNLDFIKTRIKDTALKSFRNYNSNFPQHLSNEEFEALKILSANCNLYIQKADKSNSVVTVEKRLFNPNTDSLSKKHYFFNPRFTNTPS